MMVDEENKEKLENTSSLIDCDTVNFFAETYHVCMNIFKFILFCVCIIIIVIPVSKNNLNKPNNPIKKPNKNNEEKIKPKPEEKNKPKPEEKNKPKTEEKNEPKSTEKIDNEYKKEQKLVNLYISTHKDFKCDVLKDRAYKILCDDMSQIKKEII